MPKPTKTPEEKAVFRYRRDQVRAKLPRYAALLLTASHPKFTPEQVYNVLRSPIRCYDDSVLVALEELATSKTPA